MNLVKFVQTRGTAERFNLNRGTGSIVLAEKSSAIEVRYVADDDTWQSLVIGESVAAPLRYEGLMSVISDEIGTHTALVRYLDESGQPIDDELQIELLIVRVRVDVDADRDGKIGDNEDGKRNWIWGKNQRGAIVLVNNDRETSSLTEHEAESSELTEIVVRPVGAQLPDGYELVLVVTLDEAERISLYRVNDEGKLELLLGKAPKRPSEEPRSSSLPLGTAETRCFLEAHEYPGLFFEGLLTIELQLRFANRTIGSDRAILRVAPWIMTPNTLPAVEVYACDTGATQQPNEKFLDGLGQACESAKVPLTIVRLGPDNDDRWIQDEVEFGFSASAKRTMTVVCDSPRDRGLSKWAEMQVGEDLGYVKISGSTANSLDSFGNLEVSPPVTVGDRHYPFGRIVFGGRVSGVYGPATRQMMPELRRFFHAQKIQAPIELYTDWLTVGHVDEIMTFVPASVEKKFQILLASSRKARGILERLKTDEHGDAVMFRGLRRNNPVTGPSAEITVEQLLTDTQFWRANEGAQASMDLNREILKMELGISEADIIEIPVLFWPLEEDGRTGAFFPDMVNHLVLGDLSIVARPYGPEVDGEDAFEKAFRTALPERTVKFIDDWYAYHEQQGEVHCGTNVRRQPPENVYWWEHRPVGAFDL